MLERDRRPLPHQARLRAETAQHAEVRRVARPYLEQHLAARLGLANLELLSDRPRGQVWRGVTAGGAVVVKLYAAGSAPIARRSAVLHGLLRERGIEVADLAHVDLGSETVGKWGCVALVQGFVDGPPPRRGQASAEARCLANLARIHAVAPPVLGDLEIEDVTRERGTRLPVKEPGRARETFAGDPASLAALLGGRFTGVRTDDLARVERWCEGARDVLDSSGAADSLLHGDYQSGNLIEAPDGRLVTLDLDEVLAGPFHRELGAALLRCLWGTTSRALDEVDLASLLADARVRAAEAAYLAEAPGAARDFWREHREIVIVAAYLRTIARLALRSGSPELYPRHKRSRFRRQALRRWGRVLAHLSRRA